MGKLRVLSGREVYTILEGHRFVVVRQRGSHIVVQNRLDATTVGRCSRPEPPRVSFRGACSPLPGVADCLLDGLMRPCVAPGLTRIIHEEAVSVSLRYRSCRGR